MTERQSTTIRARQSWLDEMQTVADALGVSRSDAIQVTGAIGARVLGNVTLTQAQLDALLKVGE